MTDENKDIEQVEEIEQIEEKEPKVKPVKLTLKDRIISTIIMFSFFFVIVSIFLVNVGSSGCDLHVQAPESVAQSLLQSLQSAAAIYVAQQREEPKVFSDFVTASGSASGYYTLTLDNIDAKAEFIDTKKMKLSFIEEGDGIYYLNGSEVTANFNFNNQVIEDKKDQLTILVEEGKYLIVPLIGTLYLTLIVFLIYKILSSSVFGWIIMIILIIIILGNAMVPRFTKPAIYLYPEKPTEVNITLDKKIDITLDVPKYVTNKGWHVMAYPDSKIVDLQPQYTNCNDLNLKTFGLEYAKEACLNNNYPYIYWEGEPANKTLPLQTKGWLVKTTNIKAFLTKKLDEVGFNEYEKAEFIRYWVHKIRASNKESVFISFIETDIIEDLLPMTVTPTPDSINRFYIIVDFDVNAHKNPQPQKLNKFKRNGFTLVDWGGAMIGFNP